MLGRYELQVRECEEWGKAVWVSSTLDEGVCLRLMVRRRVRRGGGGGKKGLGERSREGGRGAR